MTKTIYDPEKHYSKGTPFTYFIGWTQLNKFYYGVRYKKNCHPSDLWSNYFTSSTPVEEFRKLNGEPDIIKVDYVFNTAKEATAYEYQFIKENNCVRDSKWLNLGNGGEDFCNIGHSEETKQKLSDANRGRLAPNKGKPMSVESNQKRSDSMSGRTHSEETKQKMRKPKSTTQRMRKPKSAEHKQKQSDAMRGRIQSQETKQKRTETRKRNRLAKLQSVSDLF